MNYRGWVVLAIGSLGLGMSTWNIAVFSWQMMAILTSVFLMNYGAVLLDRKQ